jgi:formylmethanofuran dehydrogenase subunit A
MLIKLTGGKVYDPANGIDGQIRDIFIQDGRIVQPAPDARVHEEYNLRGRVVMAGGIDPHSHIGGGKVTIARMLMPEDHQGHECARGDLTRSGVGHAIPSTYTTGYRYAEMGYTACFEPAMLPVNARQTHMEMGDTPLIDKGAYVLLGSDDFLLRQLAQKKDFSAVKDYIAWTIHASQAIAVKVVNPGGISAFKFNQRKLDLDEQHAHYGLTPRQILLNLATGLRDIGVTHPLHVHGCNLGVPGNVETTLETIRAMEGLPVHMTHIQFHSYGTEGDKHFSSGAARIAEAINANANVSIDVGQVLFGQTCTASGDSWLRRGADEVQGKELRECAAVVHRSGDVPAGPRSVAAVPDDRPPQRRTVHKLSPPDPASHGQELPPRDDGQDRPRRAGRQHARLDRPRVHAL